MAKAVGEGAGRNWTDATSAEIDAWMAQIVDEVRRPEVVTAICSGNTDPASPATLICAAALQRVLLGWVRYAAVFGSCAYVIDRDDSDLDILLVGDDVTGRGRAIVRCVATATSGKEEIDIQQIESHKFSELASDATSYLVDLAAGPLVMIVGDASEFRDAVLVNHRLP
nr:nucleotidyltransferase domain-containing protein [Burkholderia ambifaria]